MVAIGEADVLQVVVLAAGAHAFLRRGGPRVVALLDAEEDVLEWFMPALVNSSVGSLAGTSDDERTILYPCCSKYRRNMERTSEPESLRTGIGNEEILTAVRPQHSAVSTQPNRFRSSIHGPDPIRHDLRSQ